MKNLLKSIFISSFPVVALIFFIITIFNFSFNFSTFGVIIPSLSVILFFSLLFIIPKARTSKNLTPYSLLIIMGTLLSFIETKNNAIYFSSTILIGWGIYLFWYSSFSNRNKETLKVGLKLANFEFENITENKVSLYNYVSNYKVLLFYRGNWCPLCMAQIKEIANEYKELDKRNASVFLISSQPHDFTKNLADKHNVPFHFLTDKNNKVAKELGIIHENGLPFGFQSFGYESDVIMPTVVITDKNNKIIFSDLTDNYRVRPEPHTFLKIIDKNQL